ncbi:MAG: phosphocholine cytidylyltransferase family protein [Patescibacteria group bacterium]
MKAVIIAGGQGKRLLPLTLEKPKCLVEVHNKPILDYQLAVLKNCGIKDIAIITGYKSDMIENHVRDMGIDVTIIENKDYATTNNAYGIWTARDYVADSRDGFLLINSDLIFSTEMLKFLIEHQEADTIVIEKTSNPESDMVKIKMEGDNIVQMSKDIPPEETVGEAVGPVKFSAEGGKRFMDFIGSFIAKGELNHWFFYMLGDYSRDNHFAGIDNPDYVWAEIDTPEDLDLAHQLIAKDFK